MKNSFEIALDQLENNIINVDGVRAINVCNAADDLLAALQALIKNQITANQHAGFTLDQIHAMPYLKPAFAAIAKATK